MLDPRVWVHLLRIGDEELAAPLPGKEHLAGAIGDVTCDGWQSTHETAICRV